MKSLLKLTVAAAAMLGAGMFASAPASARTDFSVSIGVPNAVGYDYNSGGYCDAGGCPDAYWDYPVWYGPVFFRGEWYRGPVYFREGRDGRRLFWIRGAWRHDEWYGPRPGWWNRYHYYAGPALGYSFYLGHGFRHDRDRYWRGNDWRPGREWRGRDWHDRGNINVYIGGDGRHHDHDRNDGRGDHGWNDHGGQAGHDHGSHDSGSGSSGGSSGSHGSSGGTPGGSGNPGTGGSSHGSHDNSGGTSGGKGNPGTGTGTAGTGDGSHRSHGSHGSSDSNGSSNGNADGNTNDNQHHHN